MFLVRPYFMLLFFIAMPLAANNEIWEQHVVITMPQEDAFAARQQAFVKARRDAWQQLQTQLSIKDPATTNDSAIEDMIASISIADEYTTENQYQATFNIAFDDHLVERYLQQKKLPYNIPAPARLVVPVFETADGEKLLWQPENIWRQQLENYKGNTDFILPLGDLQDIQQLQLDNLNQSTLLEVANRYGTEYAVLALMKIEEDGHFISYTLYPENKTRTITTGTAKNAQRQFLKALRTSDKSSKPAVTQLLNVVIPLDADDKWLEKQREFLNLPAIQLLTPTSLSTTRIDAMLTLAGTLQELSQQLEYLGYTLTPDAMQPELWLIAPTVNDYNNAVSVEQPMLTPIITSPAIPKVERSIKTYEVISQ